MKVKQFLATGLAWRRIGFVAGALAMFLSAIPALHAQSPEGGKKGKKGSIAQPDAQSPVGEGSNPDFVSRQEIGPEVMRGIKFHMGQPAEDRGMIRTGLTAKFDKSIYCREVDDYWAQDYSQSMGGEHIHGGIDIPVPTGTPVRAIAAGEVVLMTRHETSPDGVQVWFRHSPADTGLPMWTFSQLAHLRELPDLKYGQRVAMGQIVGITSNTGSTKGKYVRRAGIHFSVIYNDTGKYYRDADYIIPLDGRWMDPHAIYRAEGPFDSVAMRALPAAEKQIAIPYMLGDDGPTIPAGTKLIWPYPCSKTPLPATRRNPPG